MAANTVEVIIKAKDEMSAAVGKINTALNAFGLGVKKQQNIFSETTKSVLKMAAAYYSLSNLKSLALNMIKVEDAAGDMQIVFRYLTGSVKEAEKYMRFAADAADELGMATGDVRNAIRGLLGAGMKPEVWLKPMADYAAVAGQNLEQVIMMVERLKIGGMTGQSFKIMDPILLAQLKTTLKEFNLKESDLGKLTEPGRMAVTLATLKKFSGASKEMSDDWDGMITRMRNYWSSFLTDIMQSDAMQKLQQQVKAAFENIKQWIKSGDMKKWAQDAGEKISWLINSVLLPLGKWVWEHKDLLAVIGFTTASVVILGNIAGAILNIAKALSAVATASIAAASSPFFKYLLGAGKVATPIGFGAWLLNVTGRPAGVVGQEEMSWGLIKNVLLGGPRGTKEQREEIISGRMKGLESWKKERAQILSSIKMGQSAISLGKTMIGLPEVPAGGGAMDLSKFLAPEKGAGEAAKKELQDRLDEYDKMYERGSKRMQTHAEGLIKAYTDARARHVEYNKMWSEFLRTGVETQTKWNEFIVAKQKEQRAWSLTSQLAQMKQVGAGLFKAVGIGVEKTPETFAEGWKNAFDEINGKMSEMAEFGRNAFFRLRQGASDIFFSAFKGEINGIKDLWSELMNSMRDMFLRTLADMAAQRLMEGIIGPLLGQGTISGKGGILKGLGGLFHAEGGIFTRPTLGIIGEAGPEAVMPLRASAALNRGGGNNTTIINIQAMDAASFQQYLAANGGAVIAGIAGSVAPGAVANDIERGGVTRNYFRS